MSNNSTLSSLDQEFIAGIPALLADNYSAVSASVLILYDYFITFPLELQYIWQGQINIMKMLFIVNRYFGIIYLYGIFLSYFVQPATNIECRAFYYIYDILCSLLTLAVTSIFILRTYAIYGRSTTVFFLLAIPGLVITASLIWCAISTSPVALPLQLQFGPWTCSSNVSSSYYFAEMVSDVSSAVFDALVVILTMCRTVRLAKQSREVNITRSLSFILLRDGVLYYSAIFIPQLVLVVLDVAITKVISVDLENVTGVLSNITNGLQTVLVNRLVLNLSHTANTRENLEFRSRTGLEPPLFATGLFLGNIGGPVRTLPDDLDKEAPGGDENMDTGNYREITFVRNESELDVRGPSNSTQLPMDAGAELQEICV